ncbi:hypothetical protein GQ44DRAFT_630772, partial [Phaeosphaeriaceae sp. PMI808]
QVQVKKAADITSPDGQKAEGMLRMPALVNISNQLLMLTKPHTSSSVHHHNEAYTIVSVARSHDATVSGPEGSMRHGLVPRDFTLIPVYAVDWE